MAIDTDALYSPGWWLAQLDAKRLGRLDRLQMLRDYADGNARLPESAPNVRAAYAAQQRKARLNIAELMVTSVRERLHVRAIRSNAAEDGSGDGATEDGDTAARRLMNANSMAVELPDVLDNMLALGDGYMIAGRDEITGEVVATGEDPRQVVTIHDPIRQSRRLAAAKFYTDPIAGLDFAVLWVRGGSGPAADTRRWVAARPSGARRTMVRFDARSWGWVKFPDLGDPAGEMGLPTGTVEVPVVRFRNRRAQGIFELHIDHLDRINHMILQRVIIATMQAFRQRAIKGDLDEFYPQDHPQAGERIDYDELFRADPGALWMLPATAEMWESGQVDLSGVLKAAEDDIKQLAAVARMPLSIFNPESGNQSAQGATLSREGLTFATQAAQVRAGDALAQLMQLMFELEGDAERSRPGALRVEWERADQAVILDRTMAAQYARTAKMSKRWIMQNVLEMTPDQIVQEESDYAEELLTLQVQADLAIAAAEELPEVGRGGE